MNKIISFLLLLFILFGINEVKAQEPKMCCGFEHQHKIAIEFDPMIKAAFEEALLTLKTQITTDTPDKYIIPVVFHVYGTTFNGGARITLQRIEDALRKTNEDFQGLTFDYNQSDPSSRFEEIKKPLNIEFRLAKIDPTGRPCTGVNFYPEKSGFGNGGGYDEEIRKYAWDNTKYMNVYIMRDLYNDGDYYNSGVAWLPNIGMTRSNTARVVYNGSYIGTNTDENFRRVLTHEFGHFFGLRHTFEGGCTYPNDGVEDTPPVATSHWPKNTVNCEGNYTDWENFMNYTDAYRHFTTGQVALMESYLDQNARKTLWQESNLTATGVEDGHVDNPAVLATSRTVGFWELNYDGTVEGEMIFNGSYGRTFAKTGTMVLGTDYIISNIPEGLTPVLTINSNVQATLKFTGTAVNHDKIHSVENVAIVLKAVMLSGEGTIADEDFVTRIMFEDDPDSFCMFDVRWRQYAYIKKIDFAGLVFEPAYNSEQYKNYMGEGIAGFEAAGRTYTLTATIQNYDSGNSDPYRVRLWIDWDGNFILSPSELIDTKRIVRIGAPGTLHEVTFEVTVPEDFPSGKMIGFRLMLHFENGNDGEDPCGVIDSGDVHDYSAWIGPARIPETPPVEYCYPEFQYFPYAYISKVVFNGMENDTYSSTRPDNAEFFTEDQTKYVYLERGNTYDMNITYQNIDSHPDDTYTVRGYIDWNNDDEFSAEESKKELISKIGQPGQEKTATFSFTVPEDAVLGEPLHMRTFIHVGSGMAGEMPCGLVENGQYEEYYVFVSAPAGIVENSNGNNIMIYPNPTKGLLRLNNHTQMTGYILYSVDGRIMQRNNNPVDMIDISAYAKGMYILKILTTNGDIINKMILE